MTDYTQLTGTELAGYTLAELLFEEGSIVATYKAYQASLKRHVAVQILHPKRYAKAAFREGFMRASEIVAELEHANIAPVHDYGEIDDFAYIVTRWMKNGSLRERLRTKTIQLSDMVSVVKQIGSALDYVHARGMTHGDPSIANIVFDEWGNAYIADFHVAGFNDAVGPFMGTPAFMAPERQFSEATPATDQYALARVAYVAVKDIYPSVTNADPSAAEPEKPPIPPALEPVFARALATDPIDRYATVADFARAFEQALQQTPQHLFISYSHGDTDYVDRLHSTIRHNGFEVWFDDAIEHGDQWFNQINTAIKTCAAFLVIMTPAAEQSEWVQKEILLAKRYQKPIFPLLLAGEEFPILIDIQYADVRDQTLPDSDFYRRLRRTVFGQA